MKITILGTGTIAFSPTRSCSGYYLEAGEAKVLMDCGSGTCRRLAELGIPWQALTHVVLTHFHVDHHQDLPTLIFAGRYGMLPPRSAPLNVIGPAGTASLLQRLAVAYGDWVTAPGYEIRVRELAPGESLDLGGARLDCATVPHTAESVAYSIVEGRRRIVYSGDTGFDPAFAAWARGSDLLILECSLPKSMAIPEHLVPEECGEIGRLAAPALLALTHLYPPVEGVDIAAIVRASHPGPLVIASDGWNMEITD